MIWFAPLLCCITECPLEGECLMMPASDQASKSPGLWRNKRRKASRKKQLGGNRDGEHYWQPLQVGLGPLCVCVCMNTVWLCVCLCVQHEYLWSMCVNECKAVITWGTFSLLLGGKTALRTLLVTLGTWGQRAPGALHHSLCYKKQCLTGYKIHSTT